jgi:hypothetical protein
MMLRDKNELTATHKAFEDA